MSKHILVIGAGISGLSTAWKLSEAGHQVIVTAKEFSPNVTSNRAAAFWFPYHVRNDIRGLGWANKSYSFYKDRCQDAATGISIIPLIKAARPHSNDEDSWTHYMPVDSFRKLEEGELPSGYEKGYRAVVPLIETQIFLPYLQNQLKQRGVTFKQATINDLNEVNEEVDLIINCSGLGSRDLCKDQEIFPVRGQVALLEPGYPDHIFLDNQTPAYIVPRKDATIVGGTYEENEFEALANEDALQDVLQKAYNIMPALKQRKVIGNWAGLRPFRNKVRLEQEGNIIHNYGHGGSGFTLSFGCAEEVTDLVNKL